VAAYQRDALAWHVRHADDELAVAGSDRPRNGAQTVKSGQVSRAGTLADVVPTVAQRTTDACLPRRRFLRWRPPSACTGTETGEVLDRCHPGPSGREMQAVRFTPVVTNPEQRSGRGRS